MDRETGSMRGLCVENMRGQNPGALPHPHGREHGAARAHLPACERRLAPIKCSSRRVTRLLD